MAPSTATKAPENVSRRFEKTTVMAATREAANDGMLKPRELTATETFKREGPKSPERPTVAAVLTRATHGSSTTRESLPSSGDVTRSSSPVYVEQPPMLARQPLKRNSRKPSAHDTRQEGGEGVPTRDVQIPPSWPPPPPPTIRRNEHSSYNVTRAIGGRTADKSPLRPPLSADCMCPAFPPFIGLKPIG